AVAARKNIMIAGATNAGKTTLLRALANQIPPGERLVTVERALELGLDQFPDLHPNVVALEERLPNSEGQGAISMAEVVGRSLRMNPSRVIVGEVLGDEIVTMLNAMTQGNDGSLSTIHANSSMEVFNRIATYAIQAAERLPVEATHMLIAGAVDFVVFIEKRNDYSRGGSLRRLISSVRGITGIGAPVLVSEGFAPRPAGRAAPPAVGHGARPGAPGAGGAGSPRRSACWPSWPVPSRERGSSCSWWPCAGFRPGRRASPAGCAAGCGRWAPPARPPPCWRAWGGWWPPAGWGPAAARRCWC